jgi:hypothetical protein
MAAVAPAMGLQDSTRERAMSDYRRKVAEHREVEARLKESMPNSMPSSYISFIFNELWWNADISKGECQILILELSECVMCDVNLFWLPVREQLKELTKQYDKSENDLKALQSVGQVRKAKNCIK